jgi:hypothetical protein
MSSPSHNITPALIEEGAARNGNPDGEDTERQSRDALAARPLAGASEGDRCGRAHHRGAQLVVV